MFENNAKGWYGSYSITGRNLVQRFALILKKDEILSGNLKKAFYGDYFTTDDNKLDEDNNIKKSNKIDIFSVEYDKLKEEQTKMKTEENMVKNANLCTRFILAEKERYKFHQNHHKEIDRNIRLINRKNVNNLVSYHPKMDFIWKKTITGPKWQLLKGRSFNNTEDNFYKKNLNDKTKSKDKNNFNASDKYNDINTINMNKQTRRGTLPISYDCRIRYDVQFIPKIGLNETTDNKFSNNINKKNKKIKKNKFSKTLDKIDNFNNIKKDKEKYLKTYNNNFNIKHFQKSFEPNKTTVKSYRINTSNTKLSSGSNLKGNKLFNKKNHLLTPLDKDTFNKTIDFSKILPRSMNVFVQKKVDISTPPFSNPSYKYTEPRCISMVSYSKNMRDKITKNKKFIGIDPQIFLEPNKVLNYVNNHKKVSAPNFDIMSGRNQNEGPLPAYMINVWDRRSIETMTDKGLKMNNYSNSNYHSANFSMFKPKKSFNKVINLTIMKNDNEKIDEELKNINEEVFGNKKLKKLIETYAKDDKDKNINPAHFDVISLKSYKRERKKYKNDYYPLNYQY